MANSWQNGIFGFVPKEEWLTVGTDVTRPNDPIDGLFGDEKTNNLVARWRSLASEYRIPMMAQFHGFDTESRTTFRVPVDTHNIEKGLIKVKINQSEELRALIQSGVQNDELYDYVLNDGVRLADQVETRTKVAKNELMATGKVTIKENGLDLSVDYGVPAAQTAFTLDLSAEADLPGAIQEIIDAATAKGVTINGIMTAKKNLTKMRQNEAMQIAVNGTISSGATLRNDAFTDFLETEYGITEVVTNDLTYGADSKIGKDGRPQITTKRYYPDNKVTFFATNPAGRLGVGLWGDPPEVTARQLDTGASTVSNYIFVTQWAENDPAVTWTKASGLFMPVLYNPSSLWIATIS